MINKINKIKFHWLRAVPLNIKNQIKSFSIITLPFVCIVIYLINIIYIQLIGLGTPCVWEFNTIIFSSCISFIPKEWYMSTHLEISPCLNKILKKVGIQYVIRKEVLAEVLLINSLLFKISKFSNSVDLNYIQIETHVLKILDELYNYKKIGYVNQDVMENNKLYNIFRSFFVGEQNVFSKHDSLKSLFELEHFHNLILLLLILEIDLFIYHTSLKQKGFDCDLLVGDVITEEICNARILRNKLLSNITPAVRSSLSVNRISLLKRVYTGFDTEYNSIDESKNELLCSTSSTYSCVYIRVKTLQLDYTITNHFGSNEKPLVSNLIEGTVKLIRFINNKQDDKIPFLLNDLHNNTAIKSFTLDKYSLFTFKKELQHTDFINEYHDLTKDATSYSLKNLVSNSLNTALENVENQTKSLIELIKKQGFEIERNRPSIQKELFLIAHFTTADVCSWSDFEEVKQSFGILRKSLISIDRTMKIQGWKIILRDTSLLTPGMQNLGSIGALYTKEGLSKIDLPAQAKNNMKGFMVEDLTLFKEYAMRDSVLCLWHALVVEKSHYEFANKLSIPITLSSLASSFLTKELINQASTAIEVKNSKESKESKPNRKSFKKASYHNPMVNGMYGMKTLAKVNTPSGIELCGDLHDYIDYYLGSYHGGRNESYVYGVIKGKFYDYDLPGAYSTAMSLIDYADWKNHERLELMEGSDFINRYGSRIMRSYTALKVEFSFSEQVMYPNLPVRVDKSAIIFPREGISFCTGHEILLASRLGCEFTVLGGSFIPFLSLENLSEDLDNENANTENEIKLNIEPDVRDPAIAESSTKIASSLTAFFTAIESEFDTKSSLVRKLLLSEFQNVSYSIQTGMEMDLSHVREFVHDNSDLFNEYKGTNFFMVVKQLTLMRSKYPKGSYYNLLYKFLANAGIGQMARGLSQKSSFDTLTNTTQILSSGNLVNPLYGGWITSFVRCTLSELLNDVHDKGGIVISSTTDGFITDIKNLEIDPVDAIGDFSRVYAMARKRLKGSYELLELKYIESTGIISWSTRGQLGCEGKIKAMTGYQITSKVNELVPKILDVINKDKTLPFIQFSLRSAKDIYQKGGCVTAKLEERVLNMKYDNRRCVIGLLNQENGFYARSIPHLNIIACKKSRLLSSLGMKRFNVFYPSSSSKNTDLSYMSLTKRMLVRAFLNNPEFFGLSNPLNRIEIVDVLSRVGVKCLKNFVSKQKSLMFIPKSLPRTPTIIKILQELAMIYPSINPNFFLRN